MQQVFRRGYANELTFYGCISEMFAVNSVVTISLAVKCAYDEKQYFYPKILFYDAERKQNLTELKPTDFVKVQCHLETIQDYANTKKNMPYQSIVGDSIELVMESYAPDNCNNVMISGYVSNARVPVAHPGIVRLSIKTKRNYHEACIHALVYTQQTEYITDIIRKNDFLYTVGVLETRRKALGGRWVLYEDYVIKEIYRENPDTKKLRRIYVHDSLLEKEKMQQGQ